MEQPIHPGVGERVIRFPRFALTFLIVLLAIYFDIGRVEGVLIGLAVAAAETAAGWWNSYEARLKRLFEAGRAPSPDELFDVLRRDPARKLESVFDRYSLGMLTPEELRIAVAKQVPLD